MADNDPKPGDRPLPPGVTPNADGTLPDLDAEAQQKWDETHVGSGYGETKDREPEAAVAMPAQGDPGDEDDHGAAGGDHGHSADAPGHTDAPNPGHGGTPPGQAGGGSPGHSAEAPGHGGEGHGQGHKDG